MTSSFPLVSLKEIDFQCAIYDSSDIVEWGQGEEKILFGPVKD